MQKIAILTSTSPLRKTTTRMGVAKQNFNVDACAELGRRFDIIIIGSLSADDVFDYMSTHIPREYKPKFRLYPRSFFHQFRTDEIMRTTDDPRNPGWQQILEESGIRFDVLRSIIGADHRHEQMKFDWQNLTNFILDPRVVLVSGGEGSLLYERPTAVRR